MLPNRLAVLLSTFVLVLPCTVCVAQPAESSQPPALGELATDDERREKLLSFLEAQYIRRLEDRDWLTRAITVIGMSRIDRPSITASLFQVLEKDRSDAVRMVAWQAILARAASLHEEHHKRWISASEALHKKKAFNGNLRISLLQLLATAPQSRTSRAVWVDIFNSTNAWVSDDIATLVQLGQTMAAWQSRELADMLVGMLSDGNNAAYRAEFVLQSAGITPPAAKSFLNPAAFESRNPARVPHISSLEMWTKAKPGYARWLADNKERWTTLRTMEPQLWQRLPPQHLPPPPDSMTIDPFDRLWMTDLELKLVQLKRFEVVFVVDATGSMEDVIDWLKRDLNKMMQVCLMVAREPRIGFVFYRDHGDAFLTRLVPLSSRTNELAAAIEPMTADGGGDIPEAVLDGLKVAIEQQKWSSMRNIEDRNVIVLLGDAPPHDRDMPALRTMLRRLREVGVRLHAMQLRTDTGNNDLSSFAEMAEISGGKTLTATFPRLTPFKIIRDDRAIDIKTLERPECQTVIAPRLIDENPGDKILAAVISDALNPEFADRVEPLVSILMAHVQPAAPAEVRLVFPVNTPPLTETKYDPQKRR